MTKPKKLGLNDFVNVRSRPKEKKGFFHFFDDIVTCVSGKKRWTPSVKVTMKISESDIVSISDEAFAEIVLINYWDRWTTTNGKTKFTDCRNGSLEFQGWGKDGHDFYNNIYKRIQAQRLDESLNRDTDNLFIKRASKKYKDVLNTIQENNAAACAVVEEACMDDF